MIFVSSSFNRITNFQRVEKRQSRPKSSEADERISISNSSMESEDEVSERPFSVTKLLLTHWQQPKSKKKKGQQKARSSRKLHVSSSSSSSSDSSDSSSDSNSDSSDSSGEEEESNTSRMTNIWKKRGMKRSYTEAEQRRNANVSGLFVSSFSVLTRIFTEVSTRHHPPGVSYSLQLRGFCSRRGNKRVS